MESLAYCPRLYTYIDWQSITNKGQLAPFLMSSTQAIENLINGYATSEDSSFLIPNATEDFLAVRPSGNPISAEGLVGMFDSKDLVAESSELIKTHKIEIYCDMAYAFSLWMKSSVIKGIKI